MIPRRKFRIAYFASCVTIFLALLFITLSQADHIRAQDNTPNLPDLQGVDRHEITVGAFITSVHDLDFTAERFSSIFWIWATYDPEYMDQVSGEDYIFFDRLEVVNAQEKEISPTEQYILPGPNGTEYAIAKFRATLAQNWDVRHFPFDKQTLKIVVESVGVDSTKVRFVPDMENSLISDDFSLSGWRIGGIQLEGLDYPYQSTFGDPSGAKGVYPRMIVKIPLQREGSRIFLTAYLGFFISYIIMAFLVVLDKEMLSDRIGLIMTALFAAIGNKYTLDFFFPTQTNFSLSDLIQLSTFVVVAIGLINAISMVRLIKLGKESLARRLDYVIFLIITPVYPITILIGVYMAMISK